jgi:hypothetical protein
MPNLLISDLGMPDVDGFELLDWVRASAKEEGGQVPAIALTAFARSEDRLRALEAGFSAHISKPVEPSELIATVPRGGPTAPLVTASPPRPWGKTAPLRCCCSYPSHAALSYKKFFGFARLPNVVLKVDWK